MALLYLCCCIGSSLVAVSGGYSLVVVGGLLTAASLVAGHGLWSTGSVAVLHGFSCSVACEVLLHQGLNP